ncbi:MAG: 3'-5' exonuclease [Flavobacteriaceae bacterium]|nr:3'-5' exonuclease [Flavobacteriaceae bacterium]
MKIIVLDIETTGLKPRFDEIVELGMVSLDLETGEITTLFNQLFCPEKVTDLKIQNSWIVSNGFIEMDAISNAKPLSDYKHEINAILAPYKGKVTAWNRKFDAGFLKAAGFDLGTDLICPMIASTGYFKIDGFYGYKWPKAQEAWDILFPTVKKTEEHRGLDDAIMEAKIIFELTQRGVLVF